MGGECNSGIGKVLGVLVVPRKDWGGCIRCWEIIMRGGGCLRSIAGEGREELCVYYIYILFKKDVMFTWNNECIAIMK